MNIGKIEFAPDSSASPFGERASGTLNWDSAARRYVEHDTTAQETFGPYIGVDFGSPAGDQTVYWTPPANDNNRGPYVLAHTGRFYPFDPRPSDVRIEDIAHGLAHSSRYNGAGKRYYSTAEHSVLIANWIWWHASAMDALCGLLHDAPEPLSGFGDVLRPVKDRAPIIKETETNIWRRAVAPKFGLPMILPEIVHEADSRIIADEMSQNMIEMDPSYRNPLGVELQFWSPGEAEANFLKTFEMLQKLGTPTNATGCDDHYPEHDRAASAADRAYQLAKEAAA
ncbi:hypothetical protein LB579_29385 [Mesorhizobium sp. BR1-1-7]|uniref:hypothetical protein n=1 Tax=Mesorhizobium sp. BR1-1-7 TaxID=2876647 RepID=UPI001CCE6388|nr:hypothetical protein [Mesorhizobium sp. BR1-1-7]MBZ9921808.1 hypothetical protein [Mesorhizobium sp. BR1-1-7]